MASRIDTTKAERALERAAEMKQVRVLGVAVMRKPFTDGLAENIRNASYPPNSPMYLERKRAAGQGTIPWVRTGKTLEALSNNAPTDLRTQGGVRFGFNRRSSKVFAMPRVFTDHRGKRLKVKDQEKVLQALRRGSSINRLAKNAEKRGVSLRGVLSSAIGPKKRDRERAMSGARGIPARNPLFWARAWRGEIEKDLKAAIVRILKGVGLDAK